MNAQLRSIFSYSLIAGVTLAAAVPHAFARGGGREVAHLLEVGAGYVSPSMTTALETNAAGLIFNESTKFAISGNSNTNLDPIGYGGHVYGGNGRFGAAVGLRNYSGGSDANQLQFGIAGELSSLNTAVGFNGNYNLSAGAGDLIGNVGLLFNTRGTMQIGVNLLGVSDAGISAYGLGVSYDFGPSARFVLDGASSNRLDNIGLKPGLGFFMNDFQFSFAYGLDLDETDGTAGIGEGVTAGLGYEFSHSFHLQFYYKRTSDLLATASIRF